MKSKISLVTPVTEFIRHKTTKNLVNLLDFLAKSNSQLSLDEIDALEIDYQKEFISDHNDLIDFNNQLWECLGKLDLQIPWWKFLEKDSEELESRELNPSIVELGYQFAKALSDEDQSKNQLSDPFSFFYEINLSLRKDENFQTFVQHSNELSQLFSELLLKPINTTSPIKTYIDSKVWNWLFPSICQAFSSFLSNDIELKDENEIKDQAVIESIGLSSLFLISLLAIYGVSKNKYSVINLKEYLEKLKYININSNSFEILKPFFEVDGDIESEPTLFGRELWTFISTMILSARRSKIYILPAAYEVFVRSYIEELWDISEAEIKDIGYKSLYGLTQFLYLNVTDIPDWDDEFNQISKDVVRSAVKIDSGLNRITIETLLKAFRWEDDDKYEWFLEDLANKLVKDLNKEFKKSGIPEKVALADDIESMFLKPEKIYYENLSTIGINLRDSDFYSDFHHNQTPIQGYLKGAKTILQAGYVDHSVVFLSYGLLRINLGLIQSSIDFSVSELNTFIIQPVVWARVEKFLLPILILCSEVNENLSFGTRLWIKTIEARFQRAEIHSINKNNIEKPKNKVLIPEWFESDDKELVKAIDSFNTLLPKINSVSKDEWNEFYYDELKPKLKEIVDSLEASTVRFFQPIYELCCINNEVKNGINELSKEFGKELRYERISLGWINIFIATIQYGGKRARDKAELIIDKIKVEDNRIGMVVDKIKIGNSEINKNFGNLVMMRNNYLGHKDKDKKYMSRSEVKRIFEYSISDFSSLYELFRQT